MSQADIDLKGNTNFVALKNLNEEVVVPRTNLAAVDMTVGNGLVVSGNTLYNNLSEPAEILEGSTSDSIISTGNLYKALELGRKGYDLRDVRMNASANSPNAYYKEENGIRTITGKYTGGSAAYGGMYWPSASQPIREITGKFLFAVDVYNETANSTSLRILKDTTAFDTVTGFAQSTTTLNSWITLAGLVNASGAPYTGSFDLQCFVPNAGDFFTFKLRNLRLIDVTDLTDDQISYIAGNPAPYLYKPGTGISMDAETISVEAADVGGTLDGTDAATITGERLHDILSVAKAVDVTSQPYASAGTLTYETAGDYRSKITWTGSGNAKLGFYDSSTHAFPKFASGLSYILLADVKNNTTGNNSLSLTFGGTPVDQQYGGIPAGETRRVAVLFTSNSTGYFQINISGSFSLEITNLREFEVTGCTDAARRYIAYMNNPDDFSKFYLVDYDEQNPWTRIIDMGNSPAVTLMAGLAYKLDASTGTHTITTDICPAGYYGEDAHLEVFVGNTANLSFQKPLSLMSPLTANAGHNMTIKYRDGQALAYVDDTDVGYVITINSGTAANTLYYGLGEITDKYLVFGAETDGTLVDLNGVVANKAEKYVVGNGYDKTTITGSGTFTSKTVFNKVSMDGVVASGGTMTLGDVNIPNGATVAVSGGGLAIENVTGNGGVIDLNSQGRLENIRAKTVDVSNVSVINGYLPSTEYGAVFFFTGVNSAFLHASNCHFSHNSASYGGVMHLGGRYYSASFIGCTFSENSSNTIYVQDGACTLSNCTFAEGQNLTGYSGSGTSSLYTFAGSNTTLGVINGANVYLRLTSSSILDLTGNTNATPINPGGGITFASGGATVLVNNGGTEATSSYMMDNVTLSAGVKLTNKAVVNLGGTHIVVSDCHASGVTLTGGSFNGNGGGLYAKTGNVEFDGCTIAGNVASGSNRYGGGINIESAASLVMNRCVVSGNSEAVFGGGISFVNVSSGKVLDIRGSTITGNNATYGGGIIVYTANCTIESCTISGNTGTTGKDIYITMNGTANVLDSVIGDVVLGNGTTITFGGTNTVTNVAGKSGSSGSVVISSGASISLTSSIAPGGTSRITVQTGGCVVNGNAIAAGTYTKINNNGTTA